MKNQAEILFTICFRYDTFAISADSQNNLNDATTRHTVCFLRGKETQESK